MEKCELYHFQITTIDKFIDAYQKHDTQSLWNFREAFFYYFHKDSNYLIKDEVVDVVPSDWISKVGYTLNVLATENSCYSGPVFRGLRGDLASNDAIQTLKTLRGFLESAIKKNENDAKNTEKNDFFEDLVLACKKLQGNHLFANKNENERNDYIRDLLEYKGYIAKDQTRHGSSLTGKESGECDLMICATHSQKQIIIEGINLSSCDEKYIQQHLDKLLTKYDTNGNDYNVILSYVNSSNFSKLVNDYKDVIERYVFRYTANSVTTEHVEDSSTISLLKSSHTRNCKEVFVYHLLIQFN